MWPDPARLNPEISPRRRTWPKRSSTVRFSRADNSLTLSGGALSPERSSSNRRPDTSYPASYSGDMGEMNIILLGGGGREHELARKEGKRVVEGRRVSVRVESGGRRSI